MNYTEIISTLISIGWKKDLEGTQYVRNDRFKVRTSTGWEYFYVHLESGCSYLCLHSKFSDYSRDFKRKSLGITVGGIKNGQHLMRSSNMTEFEEVLGSTGRKIYEFFPLQFQRKSDLLAAVDLIAEKAGFLVPIVKSESLSIVLVTTASDTYEPRDDDTSSMPDEVSDPLIGQGSDQIDAALRIPLTPEDDEKRRKKQAENGALGEQLVMQYEIARLTELGCPNSIDCVRHVSLEDVGTGYDIQSNWNGEERCIEVKASELGVKYFFISINEIQKLGELKERGWIYRVDLSKSSDLMGCIDTIPNAGAELNKAGVLEAIQYKATLRK